MKNAYLKSIFISAILLGGINTQAVMAENSESQSLELGAALLEGVSYACRIAIPIIATHKDAAFVGGVIATVAGIGCCFSRKLHYKLFGSALALAGIAVAIEGHEAGKPNTSKLLEGAARLINGAQALADGTSPTNAIGTYAYKTPLSKVAFYCAVEAENLKRAAKKPY